MKLFEILVILTANVLQMKLLLNGEGFANNSKMSLTRSEQAAFRKRMGFKK